VVKTRANGSADLSQKAATNPKTVHFLGFYLHAVAGNEDREGMDGIHSDNQSAYLSSLKSLNNRLHARLRVNPTNVALASVVSIFLFKGSVGWQGIVKQILSFLASPLTL
jgi:hypothetical protein